MSSIHIPPTLQKLEYEKLDLPVLEYEEEIKNLIRLNKVAIIIGHTGSGKTTEIGRMMSEVVEGKIATTQPRRPAAVSVAEYVAHKHGEEVGDTVGYHIRFNDTTNQGTVLDYVTDGILIEKLLGTKTLPEYSGVILDEAHIRNLNVDFLMGLILQVNDLRKEQGMDELKILITSATIPAEKFSTFFDGAPVLQIPGKMYPVEVRYENHEIVEYIPVIVRKIKLIVQRNDPGDILVFVPGEGEIRRTIAALRKSGLDGLEVLPFFGQQNIKEQEKVFLEYPRRKVVVATNIAETSLTINGVQNVIDVGLQRVNIFDPKTGISRLEDELASMAAIEQRKGRAGRTAPGICYRLFPKDLERPEYDVPEIMRTNLAGTILKMKRLGINDIIGFRFIDQPSPKHIRQAIKTLTILGALDENEHITDIGKLMANLPLDPHISRMVVEANRYGCIDEICIIAAFMSTKSVFDRSGGDMLDAETAHRRFKLDDKHNPLSDQQSYLKIWHEYEQSGFNNSWAVGNYLNGRILEEIGLIKDDLIKTLLRNKIEPGTSGNPTEVAKSVTAGLIDNLLERTGREEYRRLTGPGYGITIHPSSALRLGELPRFIVAGEIMTNAAGHTGAFACQKVELNWVIEAKSSVIGAKTLSAEYSSKEDAVIQGVSYYMTFTGRQIGSGKLIVEDKRVAAGIFARYIASLTKAVSPKTKKEYPFLASIAKVQQELIRLHIRSQGKIAVPNNQVFEQKLANKFIENTITNKDELKHALERREINLEFELDDFITDDELNNGITSSPETIEINGKSVVVNYHKHKKKFVAQMQMTAEQIAHLDKQKNYFEPLNEWDPGSVYIELTDTQQAVKPIPLTRLEELKQIALRELGLRSWDRAIQNGVIPQTKQWDQNIKNLENFNAAKANLPEPIEYGKHEVTKDILIAYPALIYNHKHNQFKIQYYPNLERAQQAQLRTDNEVSRQK